MGQGLSKVSRNGAAFSRLLPQADRLSGRFALYSLAGLCFTICLVRVWTHGSDLEGLLGWGGTGLISRSGALCPRGPYVLRGLCRRCIARLLVDGPAEVRSGILGKSRIENDSQRSGLFL